MSFRAPGDHIYNITVPCKYTLIRVYPPIPSEADGACPRATDHHRITMYFFLENILTNSRTLPLEYHQTYPYTRIETLPVTNTNVGGRRNWLLKFTLPQDPPPSACRHLLYSSCTRLYFFYGMNIFFSAPWTTGRVNT